MLRVDLGVFAHNEASGIVKMLREWEKQETTGLDVRILVLANGCTDDTAKCASDYAGARVDSTPKARIEIFDLLEGGKSRTWNRFVHELSRPDCDVLVFTDADIVIPETDSLIRLVNGLRANSKLHAFNSHPVKDIVYQPKNLSPLDKAIAMGSETLNEWRSAICGSFYAMPAPKARNLHLPIGLAVEDGFLRAMILTDAMTIDEDFSRIDGGDVFHVFSSLRSVPALIKHQTRIVIGSAVNTATFTHLHELPVAQRHAALAASAQDEGWLAAVIRSQLPRWPFGWVPFHFLTKRIGFILKQPEKLASPRQVFVLLLGFCFDLVVYVNAQIRMAGGAGSGHW